MKRKTLVMLFIIAIFSAIIAMPVKAVTIPACEVGVPVYVEDIGGEEYFFANGAEIIVEARTDDQPGALVKWMEDGVEKSQVLGTISNIFGGMHDNDTEVESSITINGGYVNWIHGGGLHRSNTTSSTIVMNGGQVGHIKGGGADQWITGTCDCGEGIWHDGDYENAPCQTGTATITINGGTIKRIQEGKEAAVFGGGNGYSNTEDASIFIYGGDLSGALVIAGGSNGNTTTAMVYIEGGTVDSVQSVNRGTMEEASLVVVGGTVENLYVAGANSEGVTGTISGSVSLEVSGDATVESLEAGKNGGVAVDTTTDTVVKAENIVVVPGTVEDAVDVEFTEKYQVQIDGYIALVEPNTTIKDLAEYEALTEREGYKFLGFKTLDGKEFAEDTKIVENIHVETVFEKIEDNTEEEPKEEEKKDEEPKMGAEISIITILGVIAVIALAGYVVSKKK